MSWSPPRLFITALMFIMSALLFSVSASELQDKKQEWDKVSNELELIQRKSNGDLDSLIKKNELLPLVYKARAQYLRILAAEYLKGNIESRNLDQDFKSSPDYQKILNQFSLELLMESINKLKASKITELKSFIKRYDNAYPKEAIPLFRLSGSEIERESPTIEKGGFHRGNSSLFMDITRTKNGEWLFILTHELFHALDSELFSATQTFSNGDLFKSIREISERRQNLVELSSQEITLLDQWVMAGLNRGLLAEYRAWSFGFSIYEKGITEGLWSKIPFMEQVLSFKDKNENMNAFVYRYLNERSKMSSEGLLGKAVIQEKIQEKRDSFKPQK